MSDAHGASSLRSDQANVGDDNCELTPSAGALLKLAREASGLHIAALAVTLKIPVKKLEALEQDRLDLLPDAMFARALASSVCRSLNIEPAPVLQRLPQTSFRTASFHDQRPVVPFYMTGRRQNWPFVGRVSRPVLALGLAVLAAAVLLPYLSEIKLMSLLVLQGVQSRFASVPAVEETLSLVRGPGSSDATNSTTTTVRGMAVVKADLTAAAPGSSASQFQDSARTVAAGPSERGLTAQTLSPSVVTMPTASPVADAMLTLTASKESWVKVIDAKGTVLLSRLLVPGEVVQASGSPPLDAVIGRADVMRVEVRGKWLDLAPLSRDNVARFEVK